MTQNYLLSSTILYPQNGSFFIPTMINFINSCEAIGLRLVSNVSIFPMAHPYGTDLWVLQQNLQDFMLLEGRCIMQGVAS